MNQTMWSLLSRGFVALLIAWAPGCERSEVRAARAADVALEQAIEARNGETAVQHYSRSSIEHYDKVVSLAKTANPAQIQSLPWIDRLRITRIRHLCKPQQIRSIMDGRAMIVHMHTEGWIPSKNELGLTRGRVTASKLTAKVEYFHDEQARPSLRRALLDLGETKREPLPSVYLLEDGGWKLDLRSVDQYSNQRAGEMAREMGVSEDELIFQILRDETGVRPHSNIWNPPR